jgi:hypothetical protein
MEPEIRENKLKNLDNYKREITALNIFKEDILKKKELFLKKTAIQEANYALILKDFEFLKPSWKYELNPEYISNIKLLNEISMEENRMMWKTQLDNMDKGLLSSDEQIRSLVEATAKIEKELEDGN